MDYEGDGERTVTVWGKPYAESRLSEIEERLGSGRRLHGGADKGQGPKRRRGLNAVAQRGDLQGHPLTIKRGAGGGSPLARIRLPRDGAGRTRPVSIGVWRFFLCAAEPRNRQ